MDASIAEQRSCAPSLLPVLLLTTVGTLRIHLFKAVRGRLQSMWCAGAPTFLSADGSSAVEYARAGARHWEGQGAGNLGEGKFVIEVNQLSASDPMQFRVTVSSGGTSSNHEITVATRDHQRLTASLYPPAQLVESAFLFLLDREPKEAILPSFDLSVISRYFPEFEEQLPIYLSAVGRDEPH
jgi:hypothetical protein